MRRAGTDARTRLSLYHVLLLVAIFAFWYAMTTPGLVSEEFAKKTAFFFGRPLQVLNVIWVWFSGGKIYPHLWITLVETLLAFALGSLLGLVVGLWLALSPMASALSDPYIKAANAMPRVILAPIFGASRQQLLTSIYLPSATSWVFSSLHTSVGMAFVGAVVGEYLGSARGVGYLIVQAEGVFDINTVFAGILVLTAFALVLDLVVTQVEDRLLVWRPRAAETETL